VVRKITARAGLGAAVSRKRTVTLKAPKKHRKKRH
jgi:hypothetical protein